MRGCRNQLVTSFAERRRGSLTLSLRTVAVSCIALLAGLGDISSALAARSETEIVILMADRLDEPNESLRAALTENEVAEISKVAGVTLEPVEQRFDGSQVLRMAGPLPPDAVGAALRELRFVDGILYADEFKRVDEAATRSATKDDDSPVHQVVIKLRDSKLHERALRGEALTAPEVAALSAIAGVELSFVRPISDSEFLLALPQEMSRRAARVICDELEADTGVVYADPDFLVPPVLVPNDGWYPRQWHYFESLGGINAPDAWDITTGSPSMNVAVLDTGLVFSHSDFSGRASPGYDFISNSDIANDGDGRDSDASDPGDWVSPGFCEPGSPGRSSSWHGTHVAGTIGARSDDGSRAAGINWASRIVPVRVLGRCGGLLSDITSGIRWAAGLYVPGAPTNPHPARVLNLSFGGPGSCSSMMQSAINAALGEGAVVVVAAGNSSTDASDFSPANCAGVVTVAATDRSGGIADYSNSGSTVEISAPGGDTSYRYIDGSDTLSRPYDGVLSSVDCGTTSSTGSCIGWLQGTSMAAPHVAGVASLVLSVDPDLSPSQVAGILESTARSFPSRTWCDRYNACGSGILDAFAAVRAASRNLPNPTPTPQPPTLDTPNALLVGTSVTLRGSGFSEGSVVTAWTSADSYGPFDTSFVSSNETVWEIPAWIDPGDGTATLRVVNTDQGYTESNTVATSIARPVLALDDIASALVIGATKTLTGSGFTAGSVILMFVASASGPLDFGPYTPTAWTPTSLAWEIPAALPPGNGFATLMVVNTDQGYRSSNAKSQLLHGAAAAGLPTILSVAGEPLAPIAPSIPAANVEIAIAQGSTVTIGGSGFDLPLVNLYTAAGNVGPLTPLAGGTDTSFQIEIPETTVTGPGAIQVVNTGTGYLLSNAVSVPIGEALDIISISQSGSTITVNGAGFSSLSVINLFGQSPGGVLNFGGLDSAGHAKIPLNVISENRFTFGLPPSVEFGAAYVTVLNPPFIPYSSTTGDDDGAFLVQRFCGDGIVDYDRGEECDGEDLDFEDCESVFGGFDGCGGSLSCTSECKFDGTACTCGCFDDYDCELGWYDSTIIDCAPTYCNEEVCSADELPNCFCEIDFGVCLGGTCLTTPLDPGLHETVCFSNDADGYSLCDYCGR